MNWGSKVRGLYRGMGSGKNKCEIESVMKKMSDIKPTLSFPSNRNPIDVKIKDT